MADRVWTHLLTFAGGRVAVWQSPTRRFFVVAPEAVLPTSTPDNWTPDLLHPHGFSRLPDAIRAAAEQEAALRHPRAPLTLVREVLWETQPTSSCIHAERRVQSAVNQVITALRGVK